MLSSLSISYLVLSDTSFLPCNLTTLTDGINGDKDSAAVFRSRLSPSQRNTILGMNLKSISIIFDPGATERAYLAAESLSPFIPSVRVVRLQGKKDVSDRTRYEILKLESKTPFYRG